MLDVETVNSKVSGRKLISGAVKQHSIAKKQGILERLFTVWFNGLVYNQIWEDPEVDAAALQLDSNSRVLTIASGGCNLLNYLVYNPKAITAVDLNPSHMYLTRLKLAALRALPDYESFFQFFGHGRGASNLGNFKKYIKPILDPQTLRFWEGSPIRKVFGRSRIRHFKKSFYDYSRSALFLRSMHGMSKLLSCDLSKVLHARTKAEQEKFFRKYIQPSFDHWFVKKVAPFPFVVFSLGIPPQQYRSMRERGENIVGLYRDRVKRLACDFPIKTNYFAWQAFGRRYRTTNQAALPIYLQKKHYKTIRDGAEKISTEISNLTEHLRRQPRGKYNSFVFLDSQDWMNRSTLNELWEEINRVAEPGARIIFRTASPHSPLETMLDSDIRANFEYKEEESQAFYKQDRSAVYGGFHLYVKIQ